MTEERRNEIKSCGVEQQVHGVNEFIAPCINGRNNAHPQCKTNVMTTECLQCYVEKRQLQRNFQYSSSSSMYSTTFTKSSLRLCRSQNSICPIYNFNTGIFGARTTEVYMSLFNEYCHSRASGTQATALINKCLQVNSVMSSRCNASTIDTNSNYESTCTMSTLPCQYKRQGVENTRYHDVYFFGRKRKDPPSKSQGMGCRDSCTKINRKAQSPSTPRRSDQSGCGMAASCSTCVQTKSTRGASTATSTVKAVSIKDDNPKKPCPATASTKGDMMATVSHIRIGPKEPCPVHGKDPCQGPKCIVASSGEQQAPVKVTTVTNPRRGVFELIIRKMTGAPLAKNELMLEWTPPPSRPPPCGGPCPIPCAFPPPYRPSKCKLIICRPASCKPKCCKKPCKGSPCGGPCRKCKPACCGKPPCGPPPPPCSIPCTPCCRVPCRSPCKSSPCLRPCPVGRKRARKTRSQPKIKMNRKRTSPCLNRSKTCPVVRCRSMPAPCIGCCGVPPCPPRKCCSVAPCKPPKCCKSSCSMCCV